jgi:biotin operon repressor
MCPTRVPPQEEQEIQHKESKDLERVVTRILKTAQPREDKKDLELFLTNVVLFIKRVEGLELSEDEKKYPPHPQFAHSTLTKGRDTAQGMKHRLGIIDRYNIINAQRIIHIIASTAVSSPTEKLTSRQIQLILALHQEPLLRQKELAQRLSTSSTIIKRELDSLRRHFSFAVVHNVDFQKFKLVLVEIDFYTKSLDASEQLAEFCRKTPPLFLRRICFDHDFRLGYLTYQIPDQPRGHRLLEDRIKWLKDEFLEDVSKFSIKSMYIGISFDSYDSSSGAWMLGAETVAETMLQFALHDTPSAPQIRGHQYGEPMKFDRVDYLLAQTPIISGERNRLEVCQKVLERWDYELSKKTIWKRNQKLREAGVYFPTVWFDIPELEELVQFSVECTPEASDRISRIPSILPYTYMVTSDNGLFFTFQRPSRCASITGLLNRLINREEGVSKVTLLRYEPSFSPQMFTQTASRWDSSRQRWVLQEDDI